ncbi:MAG: DUF475 domain-containing protein [Methylococcaceae bacterium]|nr:DUF475 domain-containing protein [Methylococcaceae bacterium]
MESFRFSIIITIICMIGAYFLKGIEATALVLILGFLEVSLSFDNAVVNASVLKRMPPVWQQRFLTWGMLVAVFGMRLVFPVAIVAFATDVSFYEVTQMALHDPMQYAHHLESSHTLIAAFGGTFLLLVAFSFLLDDDRDIYWLGKMEEKLQSLGKVDAVSTTITLAALLLTYHFVAAEHQHDVLMGGIWGIFLYGLVSSLDRFFQSDDEDAELLGDAAKKGGVMAFMYLELLDASFSFDGVIGAFAITRDIVVIMMGLGVGAMFVRSLTVFLVKKGTLDEYVFLEHGAHYAIGALALIMLVSTFQPIPEIFTGLIGATLIGLALWSSIIDKRKQKQA